MYGYGYGYVHGYGYGLFCDVLSTRQFALYHLLYIYTSLKRAGELFYLPLSISAKLSVLGAPEIVELGLAGVAAASTAEVDDVDACADGGSFWLVGSALLDSDASDDDKPPPLAAPLPPPPPPPPLLLPLSPLLLLSVEPSP